MSPQLNAISVTDFRSLRGTVTIPLDAPVVLIHGPNGAGKTSVLSALEFALTGEILAMRRTDPNYQAHLKNRDAEDTRIVLTGSGLRNGDSELHELTLKNGKMAGNPVLAGAQSHFFSERCYLAQATLGRLLEIYQHATLGQDSPLTRFVKDLLGLDNLDALIDGLHAALDIRNTRRLVPEYAETERAIEILGRRITEARLRLSQLSEQAAELLTHIRTALATLAPPSQPDFGNGLVDAVQSALSQDPDEPELVLLAGRRRDLASLRQRHKQLSAEEQSVLSAAEAEAQAAEKTLAQWWTDAGKLLETLLDELRGSFPDLPSVRATDPETSQRTALSRVEAELNRCTRAIAEDDALATQILVLEQAVEQGRARLAIVDEQVAKIAGESATLSRALAALLPHIHNEFCPVCGRDYREVSNASLMERVSSQVARLTEEASRLQSLGQAGVQATNDLTKADRERVAAVSKRLTQDVRGALKKRIADFTEAQRRLNEVAALARNGASIIRRDVEARRRLSELRARDRMSRELRAAVGEICGVTGQPPLAAAEPVGDAIQRLESYVAQRERVLNDRQRLRRETLAQHRLLRERDDEIKKIQEAMDLDTRSRIQQEALLKVSEGRRQAARAVSRAASRSPGVDR